MQSNPYRRLVTTALLCASSVIYAQERVEPVIVTASRMAESADETLAAVTVIDREQIERSQALTLNDLLRATPGITTDVNGGRGKLTSLFLRGTESKHTLFLVDGIKVGSATSGQVALQDIPAAQIERIEVVRGPRSSLYGSEAIGGVIQIFTRRPGDGDGARLNASLTAGSYGTRELSTGVNGRHGATWYSVQVQGVETNGFDACLSCGEEDDDGYHSRSATLRAGHRFAGLQVELNALRSDSEDNYDADYAASPHESETATEVVGGRIGYEVTDVWNVSVIAGQSRDDSENFRDGLFYSRFDTVRDSSSVQNDISLGDHLLTLGLDYQADRIESTETYAVDSRINRGLFLQDRAALGAHDLQLAVRYDDNDQFGYHRTGNLAWGAELGKDLRFTAAYGTAFKAPTFNDLYYPFMGNSDLTPETAQSTELGLQTLSGPLRMDLRLFRTDVEDLISWACTANCGGDFSDDIWQPMNVNRARIDGIELALHGDVAGWATRFAVTLLDPRDQATGNLLARRSRDAVRVDTDRRFGAYGAGATLIAEGDRYDDVDNTTELAGYAKLDLRGEYTVSRDWRLSARAENVFDQDYRTAAHYAQPGRSYYLTVAYQR